MFEFEDTSTGIIDWDNTAFVIGNPENDDKELNKTVIFESGNGDHTVSADSAIEKIKFTGLTSADLTVYFTADGNAVLTVVETGEKLTIENFTEFANAVAVLEFEDQEVRLDGEGSPFLKVVGTDFDDEITAFYKNSSMFGGVGNDTYSLAKGFGTNVIEDNNGDNIIKFLDITPEVISFEMTDGGELIVSNAENGDVLTIREFVSECFKFEFADGVSGIFNTESGEFNNSVSEQEPPIENLPDQNESESLNQGSTDEDGNDLDGGSSVSGEQTDNSDSGENSDQGTTDENRNDSDGDSSTSGEQTDNSDSGESSNQGTTIENENGSDGDYSVSGEQTDNGDSGEGLDQDTTNENRNDLDDDSSMSGEQTGNGYSSEVIDRGTADESGDNSTNDDVLLGGDGDDTYSFELGFGAYTIEDNSGENTIEFLNINYDAVSFKMKGKTLTITVSDSGDVLTIRNFNTERFALEFADGVCGYYDTEIGAFKIYGAEQNPSVDKLPEQDNDNIDNAASDNIDSTNENLPDADIGNSEEASVSNTPTDEIADSSKQDISNDVSDIEEKIASEEDIIQNGANILDELYSNDELMSELLTDDDTNISEITDSASAADENENTADQIDVQVMILTENMAAFSNESNISDSVNTQNPTDDYMLAGQLLIGTQAS